MPGVVYKVSKRLTSGNTTELLVRFYHGRTDCQAPSGIAVPTNAWNNETQHLNVSKRFVTLQTPLLISLNEALDRLKMTILNAWLALPPNSKPTREWLQGVICDFHNVSRKDISVEELAERYIATHTLAPITIAHFHSLANTMKRFSPQGVFINNLTVTDIERFVEYLRTTPTTRGPGRSDNSIVAYLRKLRTLCRFAVENNIIKSSPFDEYKIPREVYGTPTYMTIEERNAFQKYPFDSDRERRCRDVFVFQCHVGCRYTDILRLTKQNVSDGVLSFIPHKTAKKTPRLVRVPLSKEALRIIDIYADRPPEYPGDVRLIPAPDLTWLNQNIKGLLKKAGITRAVVVRDRNTGEQTTRELWQLGSSHLARRTFAANLYRIAGDTRLVASLTGHVPTSPAFDRYVFVDDDVKRNLLDDMNDEK